MEAPEALHDLARNGLREIAARELMAKGPRPNAVFYLPDALTPLRINHAVFRTYRLQVQIQAPRNPLIDA